MKHTYLIIAAVCILLIIVLLVLLLVTSIGRYARYWDGQKNRSDQENPLVYVALGDSAAQSIGATSPMRGYVGLLAKRLEKQEGRPVHIINLSKSGATIRDVLDEQLPELRDYQPDIITLDIGGNDMRTFEAGTFEKDTADLFGQLPKDVIVSDIPYFGGRSRIFDLKMKEHVDLANIIFRRHADKNSIELVPLYEYTLARNQYPWSYAIDYFHPNNLGYKAWADAFWSKLQK